MDFIDNLFPSLDMLMGIYSGCVSHCRALRFDQCTTSDNEPGATQCPLIKVLCIQRSWDGLRGSEEKGLAWQSCRKDDIEDIIPIS